MGKHRATPIYREEKDILHQALNPKQQNYNTRNAFLRASFELFKALKRGFSTRVHVDVGT